MSGPRRSLGVTSGCALRIRLPYRIPNTVVEFEEDRRIARPHFDRHRWRSELMPTDGRRHPRHRTFDWSTSLGPALVDRTSVPAMNARSIEETLLRLKELAESSR